MSHYYQNKKNRFLILSVLLFWGQFLHPVFSQTTISTESGTNYDGATRIISNGLITFLVENTSGTAKVLTQVDAFWALIDNGSIPKLWYSSSSLSGAPTVTTPAWTLLSTGPAISITADGYYPTITGLNFTIPPGAQYRFALVSSNGISYTSNTANPSPNIFSLDGVNLKVGDNQIGALNIGYAGVFPSGVNNPRFFTGRVILTNPATAAPVCATNLSPANNATNINTTGSLSWNATPGADAYDVYLGTSATPLLVATVSNQTYYTFNPGLNLGTIYYYKIVPKNSFGTATACATLSFTTASTFTYCTPSTSSDCSLGDEILNVNFGTINNSSSNCSPSGYVDYTGSVAATNISQGAVLPISVGIGPGGDDSVGVWIDYNIDGNFSPSEYTFLGGSDVAATLSGNIAVPANATLGTTRMRVRIKYGSAEFNGSSACTNLTYGEIEDYAVTITLPSSCPQPIGLIVKTITSTSDSISWNKVSTAINYEYAVITSSTPPASGTPTATNNDTTILASALTPASNYYAHVRANCGSGNFSSWTSKAFFTVRTNDLCAEATDVTSNIGVNIADTVGKSTLVIAGFEGSPANAPCSGTASGGINDVWYKFTAPSNGDSVIITGASGTSSDWIYQLFASCGSTQLACSDDAGVDNPFGNTAMPLIGICGLTPGATYYVRALPYSPGTSKTCKLYIYSGAACPTPPANNNCVNAIDISTTCATPLSGTTVNASATGNIANTPCGSAFATQTDVWYKFNTGSNLIVPNIKITNIDTVGDKAVYLSVYHGSDCNTLLYDRCFSPATGANQISTGTFLTGVDANVDYYLRVYSLNSSEQTSFDISLCDSTSTLLVDTSGQAACLNLTGLVINAANQNNNRWVRLVYNGIIAEINANGQDLGAIDLGIFRNISGTVRRDSSRLTPLDGREYMDRNITITPANQPTSPVGMRLYFTNQELSALITAGGDGYADVSGINNLVVTKNQQACANNLIAGSGEILIFPVTNGTFSDGGYVEFNIPSFSTFFLHGGNNTIPIGLLSFNAQRSGRYNHISWSTSQELNVSRFVIERSADGRNFEAIGQLAAAGNSNVTTNYAFADNTPFRGINYYRLRIIDVNNSVKFSPVRNVRNEGTADVSIYPNPATDLIKLTITSDKVDKATITVVDISGKLMYSKVVNVLEGPNNLDINSSSLIKGAYIIKVQLSQDLVVRKVNKL